MKKTLAFLLVFLCTFFIEFFLLKKEVYYLPQIQIQYLSYNEQDSFQWIHNNKYFYKKNIIPLDPNYLYTYPLEPQGYIKYSKVGEEIEYYISEKQLFWKRKFTSYPYFEPNGRLIFGINADRTTLKVLDINGNVLREISGIFLVDLNCSHYVEKFYCYSLFSDGKFYIFNEQEFYSINLNKEKAYFKSFSVKDKEIGFHYYLDNNDFFEIFQLEIKDSKPILINKYLSQSKILFPYTISFTFNKNFIIFPNFKETIIVKDKIYKLNPKIDANSPTFLQPVYQQNEVSIDTSFMGEAKFYKNLIFVLKTKTLEIYDHNGNFLFSWNFLDSTHLIHIKNYLYIFLDDGYIIFKFI